MANDKEWLKKKMTEKILPHLGSTMKRSEALDLIDQLEDNQQENELIPQFVIDWIEDNRDANKFVTLERFMCRYNAVDLPTGLYNYYDRDSDSAREKVVRAILNESIPECFYRVRIANVYLLEDVFKYTLLKEKAHLFTKSEAERLASSTGGVIERVHNDG